MVTTSIITRMFHLAFTPCTSRIRRVLPCLSELHKYEEKGNVQQIAEMIKSRILIVESWDSFIFNMNLQTMVRKDAVRMTPKIHQQGGGNQNVFHLNKFLRAKNMLTNTDSIRNRPPLGIMCDTGEKPH